MQRIRKYFPPWGFRLFIIGTVLFACLDVFATITALDGVALINREKAARIRAVNLEIQHLACYLVQGVPDSADPRVKGFRAEYHCPPYISP